MDPMPKLPCIALCVEAPISLRGGVSVLIEALIEGLAGDYRIVLVSQDTEEDLKKSSIHHLLSGHVQWQPVHHSLAACRGLALDLKRLDVALVHFHSGNNSWRDHWLAFSPVWFTRRAGITTITTNHTAVTVWDNYCDPAKTSLFKKMAMLPSAWVGKMLFLACLKTEIAVSRHNLDLLRRCYWPWRRFRLIYHSRISKIGPNTPPRDRKKYIITVGHIAFRKGQHLMARAFAELADEFPDWDLAMIGYNAQSACWNEIGQLISTRNLQGRIILAGNREDVADSMQRASIFVQPSLYEGLPLALQEALASGCACIGTSVSGIPELIDHEQTGLLVPPGDVGALKDALKRLIQDTAMRERFFNTAPASIENKQMTKAAMIRLHRELYSSLLK